MEKQVVWDKLASDDFSESHEIRIVAVRHSSKPLTDIPSSGK
ncbi:MAG TPA: hypothetical protein PK228_20645 [Saprospiraceae bacterium]|nr:hypothetical protein [Saprospiraceae bacterium]